MPKIPIIHSWLNAYDQGYMSLATSTADIYSHIVLAMTGVTGGKKLVERMGSVVAKADIISTYRVAGNYIRSWGLEGVSLVRLTPAQAVQFELVKISGEYIHADPTGEHWGNTLLMADPVSCAADPHLLNPLSNRKQIYDWVRTGNMGSTAAEVDEELQHMNAARAENLHDADEGEP